MFGLNYAMLMDAFESSSVHYQRWFNFNHKSIQNASVNITDYYTRKSTRETRDVHLTDTNLINMFSI